MNHETSKVLATNTAVEFEIVTVPLKSENQSKVGFQQFYEFI